MSLSATSMWLLSSSRYGDDHFSGKPLQVLNNPFGEEFFFFLIQSKAPNDITWGHFLFSYWWLLGRRDQPPLGYALISQSCGVWCGVPLSLLFSRVNTPAPSAASHRTCVLHPSPSPLPFSGHIPSPQCLFFLGGRGSQNWTQDFSCSPTSLSS